MDIHHDTTQLSEPTLEAPSSGEPDGPLFRFDLDPIGAAGSAMVREALRLARRDARSECEALSRAEAAAELVALATPDEEIRNIAVGEQMNAAQLLAEAPAATYSNVECKLATLLRQMAAGGGGLSEARATHFRLAATTLANLVLLRGGPLTLPDGCDAPIGTADDVARWRAVAAQATGRA